MSHNDLFALTAVITATRVFLPDLRTGMRRLLRAGARVGVAELLHTQQAHPAGDKPASAVAARDTEV
ncbi:hypothetical protein ACIQB5_48705 [Streptomyces sp. NPDC088560]|uniref:hypothetical protein n=1 Tax=Streptomyces sp. NPDC088560 TaxID=3365868 RepID=UPI00380C8652